MTERGEYIVGPHLQLLSQFFIGYKVSFWGSIIGFFTVLLWVRCVVQPLAGSTIRLLT